jgi:hypothetical protein
MSFTLIENETALIKLDPIMINIWTLHSANRGRPLFTFKKVWTYWYQWSESLGYLVRWLRLRLTAMMIIMIMIKMTLMMIKQIIMIKLTVIMMMTTLTNRNDDGDDYLKLMMTTMSIFLQVLLLFSIIKNFNVMFLTFFRDSFFPYISYFW